LLPFGKFWRAAVLPSFGWSFGTKIFEAQYKSLLHFSKRGVKAFLWTACCCEKSAQNTLARRSLKKMSIKC